MGSGVSTLPDFITEEEAKRFARNKFSQAQFNELKEEDGTISKSNFLLALESSQEHELHELFIKFCPSGQLDSRTFAKMMKDTKMINSKFTNADADIIFQKAKARLGTSLKAVPYDLFHESILADIATKKEMNVKDIIFILTKSEGPVLNGTQADDVRLYNAPARRSSEASKLAPTQKIDKSASKVNDLETNYLLHLFMQYCPSGEMDSRTFVKMMIDTATIDKNFTSGDCDIIFQKVKFAISSTAQGSYSATSQGKKISFDHFVHIALLSVAEKKNMTIQNLIDSLCLIDGPVNTGTVAEANRFHDDKSTHPISYQKSADTSASPTRELKKERSNADIKSSDISRQKSSDKSPSKMKSTDEAGLAIKKMASVERSPSRRGSRLAKAPSVEILGLQDVPAGLELLFSQFCPDGAMDSRAFSKMMKDTGLLDAKYTSGDADLVFQKAKTREAGGNVAGKKVSYRTFVGICIPGIADKKGLTVDEVISWLMKAEGPKMNNVTEAGPVRFHDDKSTYTGTHAT